MFSARAVVLAIADLNEEDEGGKRYRGGEVCVEVALNKKKY